MKKEIQIAIANEIRKLSDDAFVKKSWNNQRWAISKITNDIPTLKKSGKMYDTRTFDLSNENQIKVTMVDYAKYQNEGTVNIPQRQFIGFIMTAELSRKLNKIIIQHIKNIIDNA